MTETLENTSTDSLDLRVGPPLAVPNDVFDQLAQLSATHGCELLHIGRQGHALQLVIDHADGVTIDHCSAISRDAGDLLDTLDYGNGRYVLEVSSPGLDREFYLLSDYEHFEGEQVKVIGRSEGRKVTVRGTLNRFSRGDRRIQVTDSSSGIEYTFDLSDIHSTRLEIEI